MLTAARARKVLNYNQRTGIFTWKIAPTNRVKIGDVAGRRTSCGYIQIGVDGQVYMASRLAWLITKGRFPISKIDHKDTNRANNRWTNLRLLTSAGNSQNQVKAHATSCTGILGVHLDKASGKYKAAISVNYKKIHLGYFEDSRKADQAYRRAKRKFHPSQTLTRKKHVAHTR